VIAQCRAGIAAIEAQIRAGNARWRVVGYFGCWPFLPSQRAGGSDLWRDGARLFSFGNRFSADEDDKRHLRRIFA